MMVEKQLPTEAEDLKPTKEQIDRIANLYKRDNYKVVDTNSTGQSDWFDLIVEDRKKIVFVKIFVSKALDHGFTHERKAENQVCQYEEAALKYLQTNSLGEKIFQFDVVSVVFVSEGRAVIKRFVNVLGKNSKNIVSKFAEVQLETTLNENYSINADMLSDESFEKVTDVLVKDIDNWVDKEKIDALVKNALSEESVIEEFFCTQCGETKAVKMPFGEYLNIDLVRRKEVLIQDALSSVSPEDRELIRSTICGSCWNKMFSHQKR